MAREGYYGRLLHVFFGKMEGFQSESFVGCTRGTAKTFTWIVVPDNIMKLKVRGNIMMGD